MPVGNRADIEAVSSTLKSGWWGKGPRVAEFEKNFAEMVGAKHALAVTSNTQALDLVLRALGATNGDVISPAISFMTTAMVPLWGGNTSTIVDVREDNLCISATDARSALKKNTKAIIAVNYNGYTSDIDDLRNYYDGPIVEDCAHSCYTPGAGSRGDVAVWSFQAVKTLPTGDGGMITLNDTELYERLVPMTWLGISSTYSRIAKTSKDSPTGLPGYSWDYEVDSIGYKAYMTDLTASLGLSQMKQLRGNLEARRNIQSLYNSGLDDRVQRPVWSNTAQYYPARVPARVRNKLIDFLASKKIHTSVHYKPLYSYAVMPKTRQYPVSDVEWTRLISLPCHPGMTVQDVEYVIYWVNRFFESHWREED